MTFRVGVNVEDLERDLRDAVDGEVRFDAGTLGAYSTDGSNYRQVPLGVAVPRTPDAAAAAVLVCARHRAPVLSRGGGTSLAGECTNTAVVLDWTKYCHEIEHVDVERRTCVVQPGVVLDVLNDHLAPTGLRFGPEPSTHPNCTIGGMLGNNSCGATAQTYGKAVDNIRRLEVVTYRGDRFWLGPTDSDEYPDLQWDAVMAAGGRRAEIYRELKDLTDDYADRIRDGFPHIPRRVSGYNLDSLLPEHGFHLAKAVVGSEGTCLTILRAELELAPAPKATSLVLLGYPDSAAAADAVPAILPYQPFKLEGVDKRLVDLERTRGMHKKAMTELPDGAAWLFVSLPGTTPTTRGPRRTRWRRTSSGTPTGPTVGRGPAAPPSTSSTTPTTRRPCGRSARAAWAPPPAPAGPGRPSRTPGPGGGLRRRPRPARRLHPRLPPPAPAPRLRERLPLRPLRPGLPALPDPVRPRHRRRAGDLPGLHARRRRASWSATAGRCRASTATARPAARSSRPCSGPSSSRRCAGSAASGTPTG